MTDSFSFPYIKEPINVKEDADVTVVVLTGQVWPTT